MKIKFDSRPERPDEHRGMKIPYPPERRKPPVWRWYLLLLLFLSPVLYFAWTLVEPMLVVQAPGFVRMGVYPVHSPESGRVAKVFVTAHQKVQKSELLVRLHDEKLDAAIASARKELAALRRLRHQEGNQKAALLAAQLASADEIYKRAKERYDEMFSLFKQGAVTREEVERARAAFVKERATREKLTLMLNNERRNLSNSALDARIAALQAKLEALVRQRETLDLEAPVAGSVENLEAKEGLYLQKGAHLLDILNDAQLYAVAYFDPRHFDRLKRGTEVVVKFADGKAFEARLDKEATTSTRLPGDFSLLKENKRAVLAHLRFLTPLPPRYRIENLPVKVYLKSGWSRWLIGL
ncbi:HlyD family secretion protein [Hydrogenimonas sp.]